MANDDQRRKNFWDDDEEEDLSASRKPTQTGSQAPSAASDTAEMDRRIQEARVLMEQTHQLFQLYFNGVEKRVPIEKLKILEGKINELQRLNPNLTAVKFRITQFLSQYNQMKELWDRKLRERERK